MIGALDPIGNMTWSLDYRFFRFSFRAASFPGGSG